MVIGNVILGGNGITYSTPSTTQFVTLPPPSNQLSFTYILSESRTASSFVIRTHNLSEIIVGQVLTSDINSATDADFETVGVNAVEFVINKAVRGDRITFNSDGTRWYVSGASSVFDAILLRNAELNMLANNAILLDARFASDLTLSGGSSGTASQWNNRGNVAGVGNAIQGTVLRQPLYVASGINGRPTLQGRHDGVNASQLDIADSAGLDYTQFTVYAVYERNVDLGAQETIAGKYNTTGNLREHWVHITAGDTLQNLISNDGINTGVGVNGLAQQTVNVPRIVRAQYNGIEAQIQTIGSTQQATPYALPIFQGAAPYSLFARPSFASPLAGEIGCLAFFTRSLSAEERAFAEAVLTYNWGF